MSTTSSKNFTTLYSGSGSVVPQGEYGNANVVSLLNVGTDGANTVGNISATGTVTAGYFAGDGSQLTNITAGNITGNVNYANTAGTADYVTANAQANITSVGVLTSLSSTGNITGGNLITAGAVSAASVSASGNVTAGGVSTTGNVTAANFFGNVYGNIVGNVDAAGANTQIQFNTGNLLDASANLTFDKSTSILKVTGNATYPTAGLEVTGNTITGNLLLGNLVITNQFQASSRGPVVVDTTNLIVGQDNAGFNTNATITAIRNQALQLTTTNAGAPSVIVGKYVSGNPSLTGNVDVASSNVGGYGGTGNINLSGNVYVGRNAQGADTANAKANLIVTDSVYINQNLSVAGNISIPNLSTTGNITAGNFITSGNLFGNVVASTLSGVGTANLDIIQNGNTLGATALNLQANVVVVGKAPSTFGGFSNSSVITSPPGGILQLTTDQGNSSGDPRVFIHPWDGTAGTGNIDLRSAGGAGGGGFFANGQINMTGNVNIGPYAFGVDPTSPGILNVSGNITGAYIIGNGSQLSNITAGNVTGTVGTAQYVTANAQANITSVGTLTSLSVSGNIDGGNLRTAGLVTATGNISGGNVIVPINGKYRGDFSTAPAGGRTVFQTTSTGTTASSFITVLPGVNHVAGAGVIGSATGLFAANDVANSSFFGMYAYPQESQIRSSNFGGANVNDVTFRFGGALFLAATITQGGNIVAGSFIQNKSYTKAALTAITGTIGQMAAVSDSASGGNPNGMIAFWDTTNARWSYIHDNSAV